MYQGKKIGVIIVAAGSGTRMGGGIPKQFRELGGIPILTRAAEAFFKHPLVDDIFIVTKSEYLAFCKDKILAPFGLTAGVVTGGVQRQDSVKNGLQALPSDTDFVLVHDGARPFVSERLITDCIEMVVRTQAAVAAVPVKDTVKRCEDGVFAETPERSTLYNVQTPQCFSVTLLREAFQKAEEDGFSGTDDSILVERMCKKVYLVKGEYSNIKITTEEDMLTGEAIASKQGGAAVNCRIGTGYDVHRLAEGRRLILGGVEIPYEKGLLGHSDADVLLHAVMDALLGAAGLGDIGQHFPDSDDTYKGISSLELLARTRELLLKQGAAVGNVDCTVIAQQPRLAAHIPQMRNRISETLHLRPEQINVKATTTEKLGFCGRGEGIAAEAAAMVYMR